MMIVIIFLVTIPRMKCTIVGFPGNDAGIAVGAKRLYSLAGFDVSVRDGHLEEADLLVILRGSVPWDCDYSRYKSIHVYSYVCPQDFSYEYLSNHANVTVISTCSSYIHPSLCSSSDYNKVNIISYPPVFPEMWFRGMDTSLDPRKPFIHIGHFKGGHARVISKDEQQLAFLAYLAVVKADVYGRFWESIIPDEMRKGELKQEDVTSIYSQYKYALGIMYDYQRVCSFSGRFFEAPLAGCLLLTEAIPGELPAPPGVFLVDYTKVSTIMNVLNNHKKAKILQQQAYKFWFNETLKLADRLGLDIQHRS